jgi:hypothetical protein
MSLRAISHVRFIAMRVLARANALLVLVIPLQKRKPNITVIGGWAEPQ